MTGPTEGKCPVCKCEHATSVSSGSFDGCDAVCQRCGPYKITEEAIRQLDNEEPNHRLCAWLRAGGLKSQPRALLTTHLLAQLPQFLPDYGVADRMDLLLEALASMTERPGDRVDLTLDFDYPLAWAAGRDELKFYLDALAARGLVESFVEMSMETGAAEVTAEGWERVDDRRRRPATSDQAFVAMSFADEMIPAWQDGIAPAVAANRFRPYRVDREPHNDRIDAKIISEIRKSRFLIADVTLHRPGVYYEAGFAQGLGLQVLWTVRADELEKAHFDTRQFRHVVWTEPADLREQLTDFIGAIIGQYGKAA